MITPETLRNIVLDAAKEVFETMVCTSLEATDATARPSDTAYMASITFKGGIEGRLGIHCDHPCAQRITAGMLCDSQTHAHSEVVDALGELTNMVMGRVKARLRSQIKDIQVSVPSVIEGRHLRACNAEGAAHVTIPVTIAAQAPAEFSFLYRLPGMG